MNILRIGQNIKTGDQGGGGTYHMHALSRDQAKRGHNITVVTVSEDGNGSRRTLQGDGWSYDHVDFAKTVEVIGSRISIEQIRETINVSEYDVIHLHSHLYFSTFSSSLLNWWSDTPVVITNHGLISSSVPPWISKLQLRTMGWITYSASDLIFCYTDIDKQRLRSIGVSTPITVISNGIDSSKFSPNGSQHPRFDSSGPNIVFVGRLVEGKRPDMAIKAFARLCDRYPDAELYLCGDGPMQAELERLVEKLGIGSRTNLLGNVSYSEMPGVYRASDITVLPSKAEGFPRTVLESLACGVPVVTSDLAQLRSVVKRTGKVVNGQSEEDIAEKLDSLLSDDAERSKLGETGRKLVEENYSWDQLVTQTTEAMRQITS